MEKLRSLKVVESDDIQTEMSSLLTAEKSPNVRPDSASCRAPDANENCDTVKLRHAICVKRGSCYEYSEEMFDSIDSFLDQQKVFISTPQFVTNRLGSFELKNSGNRPQIMVLTEVKEVNINSKSKPNTTDSSFLQRVCMSSLIQRRARVQTASNLI